MTNTPPRARPRAYNTGRRHDLTNRAHREEMIRDYDLAESRGDEDLALWARSWGEALRSTVVSGHDRDWRHQEVPFTPSFTSKVAT